MAYAGSNHSNHNGVSFWRCDRRRYIEALKPIEEIKETIVKLIWYPVGSFCMSRYARIALGTLIYFKTSMQNLRSFKLFLKGLV